MDRLDIYIKNGNVVVVDNNSSKKITFNDEKKITLLFNELASCGIKKKYYDSKNEALIIENKECVICLKDYFTLRCENYFNQMQREIVKYNKSKARKAKLTKSLIASPLVVAGLTMGLLLSSSISSGYEKDTEIVETNDDSNDEKYSFHSTIKMSDDEIKEEAPKINDDGILITEEQLKEKYDNIVVGDDLDPLYVFNNYDKDDDIDKQLNEKKDVIDANNYNVKKDDTSYSKTSVNLEPIIDIKPTEVVNIDSPNINIDLNEYEDIISFASNIYGINTDLAKKIVLKYWDAIISQKGNISFFMPYNSTLEMIKSDTDRIKDLKEKGYIDPDIIRTGIFLSIGDYAYSLNTIGKNVQKCQLSREERESFILNIAENIYGVKDDNIKALLLSATWIESNTGTSTMGINRNNIGGNTGAGGFMTFDTFEQGACEYVYSMLKTIDRTFYSEKCSTVDNLFYKIALIYCEETWVDWGREVSNEAAHILEVGKIGSLEEKNTNLTR